MGPGHQALREMNVGWGLGLGSEVLPAETCPLSQGWALDIGPRLGAGYPDCPGPLLRAWAWTPAPCTPPCHLLKNLSDFSFNLIG